VLPADGLEAVLIAQVVVAIGQTEAAAADRSDDHLRILHVVLPRDAEQWAIALVVQAGQLGQKRRAIADRLDAIQLILDRRHARRLDGWLVHAGSVEVADFLLRASARRGRRYSSVFFQDRVQRLAVALGQLLEAAKARVLRRQRMRLPPLADGEAIEVIAGVHRRVHAGEIETVRAEERG